MSKKIEELDKKITQLKHQKREILARENEQKRKARTHRLIERGAIFEKYFEVDEWENEQVERLCSFLIAQPSVKQYLLDHQPVEEVGTDEG